MPNKLGIRVIMADSDFAVEVECTTLPSMVNDATQLCEIQQQQGATTKSATTKLDEAVATNKQQPAVVKKSTKNAETFFEPKRDRRMEKLMGKIESDKDVWVERFYLNKKDRHVYYFRSVRTKRCVLWEPPTGSGTIVYLHELDNYPMLREFATEPLDRRLTEIERPEYKGETYRERQKKALAKKKKETP
jgi:glycerophosphoryl diester phosphodiesterase